MVSASVTVDVDHINGTADFQIFQVDVSATNTNTIISSMVYQEGDSLKVQTNAASKSYGRSFSFGGKATTIMYVISDVPKKY